MEVEKKPQKEEEKKKKKSKAQISKYRELLKGIQSKEKKLQEDKNMEMEITWVPGMRRAVRVLFETYVYYKTIGLSLYFTRIHLKKSRFKCPESVCKCTRSQSIKENICTRVNETFNLLNVYFICLQG